MFNDINSTDGQCSIVIICIIFTFWCCVSCVVHKIHEILYIWSSLLLESEYLMKVKIQSGFVVSPQLFIRYFHWILQLSSRTNFIYCGILIMVFSSFSSLIHILFLNDQVFIWLISIHNINPFLMWRRVWFSQVFYLLHGNYSLQGNVGQTHFPN